MLPTLITSTPQTVPKGHYGKISNLVHHGQHALIGLTACSPSLCSHTAVSLPGQHHAQGLTSAVLAAKQHPIREQAWMDSSASSARLFLIRTPGRCAVFWQSLALCFTLLQMDWRKQVPPAEQLPKHVCEQKQSCPIRKSAPCASAPRLCRKSNFLPARGWARAPVPATSSWATARWGLCGRAALAEVSAWHWGNPRCPPCLHYPGSPATWWALPYPCHPPPHIWEKILKADSVFNMKLSYSASKETKFQVEPPCAVTQPIMNYPNFKWCRKRP